MKKIFITFLLCMIIILSVIPNLSYADINTGEYKKIYENQAGAGTFLSKAGEVLGVIQVVGISIATIILLIVGIKYMTSSVQEKAAAKEQLIMFGIGAILLFGGTTLITYVAKWANGL